MKKKLLFSLLGILFLVGCNVDNSSSSDNQPDSSQNIPSYTNPIVYDVYPQTIIVNGIRYDMIVDLTNPLNYELNQLIGHIIHEEFLESYKGLYPGLIPVIDNSVQSSYTNNMIEIYSVKEMDITQYLAIKINGHTELFKAN